MAIELTQDIGRRITAITHQGNYIPPPTFIHRSSKGKCGLLPQHYGHHFNFAQRNFQACGFVLVGPTKVIIITIIITRMWANAQRDGRRAEYRWRPLFNAAKFR